MKRATPSPRAQYVAKRSQHGHVCGCECRKGRSQLCALALLLLLVLEEGLLEGDLARGGERELLLQPLRCGRRLVPPLDELELGDTPLAVGVDLGEGRLEVLVVTEGEAQLLGLGVGVGVAYPYPYPYPYP